jgi:hypothetical protein
VRPTETALHRQESNRRDSYSSDSYNSDSIDRQHAIDWTAVTASTATANRHRQLDPFRMFEQLDQFEQQRQHQAVATSCEAANSTSCEAATTRRLAKRSNQISNPAINPDLDDDSIGVRSVCDLSIDSKQQAIDPLSSDLG